MPYTITSLHTPDEQLFEVTIADSLAGSDLYCARSPRDFDIDRLVDREMLEAFLKAQHEAWAMLQRHFPGRETDAVITEYNTLLNRGESILKLLQKGFTLRGAKIKLVQFKPSLADETSSGHELYRANRFAVVRQMRYSNAAADSGNELDLCILINGIPLFTCELKNEATGQNYTDGIRQYREDRNPDNRMLRNCLVHFVIDNNYVFMTTQLCGKKTYFLPFNKGTVNPPVEGKYATCYMWEEIFQADSLLDIIENFLKRVKEGNGYKTYFPRFHQLRAVRKLRKLVREEGPGHNYLVQHSAGSGKTKSMAWLAHQLANMTNEDKTPIFNSIVMVTDRIVLNRNMAEDVVAFETTAGTVRDIRRGSKNLATALDEGHRIIISTVQKFAYALKTMKRATSRKYAVIIDEAHTAVGNESSRDITHALTTDEDLTLAMEEMGEYGSDNDPLDALMAYMQKMRSQMPHISYFAFTATPKDTTFALYGKDGKTAHDLYSMQQAIDEKFILDVLQNYRSYQTMFELIEKDPEKDQEKLFENKKAQRVISSYLNNEPYIRLRKAVMILEHFTKHTMNKIGGKAKAMVVTDSRRSAADFKSLLDRIIHDQYSDKFKTLVAFSGEVEDSKGRRCSEASMNDERAKDDDIRLLFERDEYRILIVAEKFQTGFDQKLLHTMYVDRQLGGIQAIQTLSRLNRCCPPLKEDTCVVDFRNAPEHIQAAFQDYYRDLRLEGEVDTQRMYRFKRDIDDYMVFNEDEVREVCVALQKETTASEVPSVMRRIVDERVKALETDRQDAFRKLVNRYVRQYGFMAQLFDFIDPDLEKFYVFCKVLYKFLPYTKESLPMEVLELIDLNKLRIQLQYDGQLKLEDEDATMQSARIGDPGVKKPDELKSIKEILDIVNEPYEGFLDENDKIIRQIWEDVIADPDVADAFRANNSYEQLIDVVREKFNEKVSEQLEKYFNFSEVLDKEPGFTLTLMRRIVDKLAEQTARERTLEYDEEALKDRITSELQGEFAEIQQYIRPFDEVVDRLFFILNQPSIPTLDGADEMLKDSLNQIYLGTELRPVDKRRHFNSLVSKYEAFLKKLYYLINSEELPARDLERSATFADAIYRFRCLWGLRNNNTPGYQKFSEYLDLIRDIRNQEAHEAFNIADEEVNAVTTVVVAMYLFVVSQTVTDLEMAGY